MPCVSGKLLCVCAVHLHFCRLARLLDVFNGYDKEVLALLLLIQVLYELEEKAEAILDERGLC